jgi:hypothetical protein
MFIQSLKSYIYFCPSHHLRTHVNLAANAYSTGFMNLKRLSALKIYFVMVRRIIPHLRYFTNGNSSFSKNFFKCSSGYILVKKVHTHFIAFGFQSA